MGRRTNPLPAPLMLGVLLALAGGGAVFGQQPDGPRYALVIGNSAYSSPFPVLKNPVNDARALAASLRSLGFQVTDLYNQNQNQIRRAVIHLRDQLASNQASEGFFYFAGHGVQAGGVNYLIPLDAELNRAEDLEVEGVSLQQEVLDEIQGANNKVNIIILDACRDNPLPSRVRGAERGLAVVKSIPPESTILFSTADNTSALDGDGPNSPFASALLRHLGDPTDIALTIKAIASEVSAATGGKQTPTAYGIIRQSYMLNPRGSTTSVPVPEGKPVVTVVRAYGSVAVDSKTTGTLYLNKNKVGSLSAGSPERLDNIEAGAVTVEIRYSDGKTERQTVDVKEGAVTPVSFTYTSSQRPVSIAIGAAPSVEIPLGWAAQYYNLSGSGVVSVDYPILGGTFFLTGGVQYAYLTLPTRDSLSVGSALVGAGARYSLSPLLELTSRITGGYWVGTFNNISGSGSDFFFASEFGVRYAVRPTIQVGIVAHVVYYNNLFGAFGAGISTTFLTGGGA